MNGDDIHRLTTLICALYPRLRFSDEEWSVVAEDLAASRATFEAAAAALRGFKASDERYPRVATILKLVKATQPRTPVRKRGPETVNVLDQWAGELGMTRGCDPRDIVTEHWRDAFERRVRLAGCVSKDFVTKCVRDLVNLACMAEPIAEQAAAMLARDYPLSGGMSSAGSTSSASASRAIVSTRTERCPRSIRLMWVRWSFAASARASCDNPRRSRIERTRSPNRSLYGRVRTCADNDLFPAWPPQTMRNN